MTLNRNGLMARYIRFISIDNYYPSSFCILFWYLVFSPIIGIKNYIFHGIALIEKRHRDNARQKHNLEVDRLVIRYKNDPELFMTDYHLWSTNMKGYYLSTHLDIVKDALEKYRCSFEHLNGEYGTSWRDIIKHLNLCQTEQDNYWWYAYNSLEAQELVQSRCERIVPPTEKHPAIQHYFIAAKGFWTTIGLVAIVVLPIFALANAMIIYSVIFGAIISLFFAIGTYIYLDIDDYLKAMYQMFIKKACPTIEWE